MLVPFIIGFQIPLLVFGIEGRKEIKVSIWLDIALICYLKNISNSLEKYINPNGTLNGMKIEDDWFPNIRTHVFLSHSHKDIDFVKSFAGWLYEKFKIKAFIDSSVWANSGDLLKTIDNEFCVSSRHDNGTIKTYGYL